MNIPAEQAQAMAMMMIEGIEREAATTRRVIAAIPEDKLDFSLGEKGRKAGEIAWHIIRCEAWFAQSIIDGAFGAEDESGLPATTAAIVEWYDANVPALTDKLKRLTAEQWAKTLDFYGVYNMPAAFYLDFWKVHSIHHRGYLAAYLRAMNARVPSIYGGSADEPFQMPASA